MIVLVIVNTARTIRSNLLYIVSELVMVSVALLCALYFDWTAMAKASKQTPVIQTQNKSDL